MKRVYLLSIILTSLTLCLLSCGNKSEESVKGGNVYFSAKIDGNILTDNRDGGILDPITNMLLDSGENENYVVGIRIPTNLKPGETSTDCKGFVHKIIHHSNGVTEHQIFELVQSITLNLTSRRKGYAEGTFAFSVKRTETGSTITVTEGKFGMNIINDEF